MRLTMKGKICKYGKCHEYRITLNAPTEVCDHIGDIIKKKLQEKGWMP